MGDFQGFPAEYTQFFSELAENNSKDWFSANRKRYDDHIVATSKAFVPAFGERLREFLPLIQFEAKANRSLGRINRDVRFSKDKRPYNRHMTYRFWEGEGKVTGNPHFTVWVGHEGIGVGAGMRGFPKERIDEFRDRLVEQRAGDAFSSLAAELVQAEYEFIGEKYKRVPKGYDPEHPNAKWLKFVGMACYVKLDPPRELNSIDILDVLAEHCEMMAPLHDWIMEWY